jgi:hypothetical protein
MPELVQWLTNLPLSLAIRKIGWVIPLMQTIHILANGIVLSSVIMVDLRMWGIARSRTLAESTHRFVPWVWAAMVLLTITGVGLILAAPRRTLLDPSFQVKMVLTALAIPATLLLQAVLGRNHKQWDENGAGLTAGVAAGGLLILWIAVTFAGRGRWIVGVLGR